MTIRFGNQVRLASRDRFRLMLLLERDPGDIVSFAQLQALMQQHRATVRGVSREAEFLRWLMDREWNRLAPGSGYREPLRFWKEWQVHHPAAEKWMQMGWEMSIIARSPTALTTTPSILAFWRNSAFVRTAAANASP
jgi:hypothetical protein